MRSMCAMQRFVVPAGASPAPAFGPLDLHHTELNAEAVLTGSLVSPVSIEEAN